MTNSVYIIERDAAGVYGGTQYLNYDENGVPRWVKEKEHAMPFASAADAEYVMRHIEFPRNELPVGWGAVKVSVPDQEEKPKSTTGNAKKAPIGNKDK